MWLALIFYNSAINAAHACNGGRAPANDREKFRVHSACGSVCTVHEQWIPFSFSYLLIWTHRYSEYNNAQYPMTKKSLGSTFPLVMLQAHFMGLNWAQRWPNLFISWVLSASIIYLYPGSCQRQARHVMPWHTPKPSCGSRKSYLESLGIEFQQEDQFHHCTEITFSTLKVFL